MFNQIRIKYHADAANEKPEVSAQSPKRRKSYPPETIWHCRESWFGDSRDGLLQNGDGYHYFQMKGDGVILKAIEWYESDDGEEHTNEVPELVGLNWFEFFGFEDDEILEPIEPHQFSYVEYLLAKKTS